MKPATLSTHYITRGNTYKEILRFTKNGEAIDLSQMQAIKMDIRYGSSSNSQLLQSVALQQGIEVSEADPASLTITIAAQETQAWKAAVYYRKIEFTNPNGEVYTYAQGIITVLD